MSTQSKSDKFASTHSFGEDHPNPMLDLTVSSEKLRDNQTVMSNNKKDLSHRDEDVAREMQIVRASGAKATGRRYEAPIRMYEEILKEMNIDPLRFYTLGTQDRFNDPI